MVGVAPEKAGGPQTLHWHESSISITFCKLSQSMEMSPQFISQSGKFLCAEGSYMPTIYFFFHCS